MSRSLPSSSPGSSRNPLPPCARSHHSRRHKLTFLSRMTSSATPTFESSSSLTELELVRPLAFRSPSQLTLKSAATGEHAHNRMVFKQLLQANAIDVCQIDSCRLAGVNEILAVLLMAAKFNVPVCPHAGGVGLCEYVIHRELLQVLPLEGLPLIILSLRSVAHRLPLRFWLDRRQRSRVCLPLHRSYLQN